MKPPNKEKSADRVTMTPVGGPKSETTSSTPKKTQERKQGHVVESVWLNVEKINDSKQKQPKRIRQTNGGPAAG